MDRPAEPEQFTASLTVEPADEYTTATLRDGRTLHSDEPSWLPEGWPGTTTTPHPSTPS